MEDCIFCKIAAGKIPAPRAAENDELLAFPDIDPQAPVHLLIIPKKHVKSLKEVQDWGLVGRMHQFAVEIADKKGIGESGYRVLINTGPNGVQTVLHLHMHLLGGRIMGWPPG
jgi:histidine triad (HIT) family protein